MTYTIESSYSMYEGQGGNLKLMQVEDWKQFGDDLVNCIVMGLKLNQGQIKNTKELKKMTTFNEQQTQLIKRIKIDIKKEKKKTEEEREEEKDDSDGESNDEDLNVEEREQTEKKILQNCLPSYILPKVLKPTVLYPTVTPKLFEVNEQKEDSFKILYTKRNKYNSLRMANANTIYTNYIKNNLD